MIPTEQIIPADADRALHSLNFGKRSGPGISMIVLHATADGGNEAGAESWMRSAASQVSAHLHIRRDGSVTRLVSDLDRAWHAGRSEWGGITDVNSASLGWEIANRNDGEEPYTDAQYRTVARLLQHYLPQGISRADVVSHEQIAPGRKTDPYRWDWGRMWALVDVAPPPPPNLDIELPIIPAPDVRERTPPPEIPAVERPKPRLDHYTEDRMQIVQAKPWWQSKLVWLGAAQAVLGAAEIVSTTPILEGSEIAGIAAAVSGALTVLLRLVTKRPVAASAKPVQVPE